MNTLQQWLNQQRKHQSSLVTITEALFGNEILRYFLYRLRYFSLNTVIQTVLHLVEFLILSHYLSAKNFYSIIVLRVIALTIQGYWWGHCELLRSAVRTLQRRGDYSNIKIEIQQWLLFTACCSLVVIIFSGLAVILLNIHISHPNNNLFIIYSIIILLTILLQMTSQTLHAGAYGLRRVYRPFWSIPVSNIASLLLLFVLWPLLGVLSLPLAMIASTVLAFGLTVYFTLKTLDVLCIRQVFKPDLKYLFEKTSKKISFESILAGLCSLIMRFDTLVIAISLTTSALFKHDRYDAYVLYLLAPLISASFEWPRLFYFDLKRLNRNQFSFLRKKLSRIINIATFPIGVCLSLIAITICLRYTNTSSSLYLALILFFTSRSYLAYLQMTYFTDQRYKGILSAGLVLIALTTMASTQTTSITTLFFYLAIISLLSSLFLAIFKLNKTTTYNENPTPYFYQWLSMYTTQPPITKLYELTVQNHLTNKQTQLLLNQLNNQLDNQGKASILDKNTILMYSLKKQTPVDQSWLATTCSGIVLRLRVIDEPIIPYLKNKYSLKSVFGTDELNQMLRATPQASIQHLDKSGSMLSSKSAAHELYHSMLTALKLPLSIKFETANYAFITYNTGIKSIITVPKSSISFRQLKQLSKAVFLDNINTISIHAARK